MYPNEVIIGLTLYEIFLAAGVLSALIVFRILSDKAGLDTKLFNFCLASGVVAIVGGYGSAVLFQAYYNYRESGVFRIAADTGATFYGGLIGGAAIFLFCYFVIGRFVLGSSLPGREFYRVTGMAAASITSAHSLGRVGCLMAGCCHGLPSAKFGIYMEFAGGEVVPVQLFEAVFLLLLTVLFFVRSSKGKGYNLAFYMMFYGVWRFFIEYLRGDNRGETLIGFLSPSQLTALILIFGGIFLFYFERRAAYRKMQEGKAGEPTDKKTR